MKLVKCLIVLFVFTTPFTGHSVLAQDCDPIPLNRGKEMRYAERTVKSVQMLRGTRIDNKDTDIVYLYDNGDTMKLLVDYNNQVLSPIVSIEGRVDSIKVGRGGATHLYDIGVRSGSVYASYFKKADSLVYYNRNGAESLILARYPNGLLKRQVIGGTGWGDDDTRVWNDKGVLISRDVKDRHYRYYKSGVLHTYQYDTLIKGFVTCKEEYYPNGRLHAAKYYEVITDSPCHLWRFYNPDGMLTDTIRYRPSLQMSGVGIMAAPPRMTSIGDEVPRPPASFGYIDTSLKTVLCQSTMELMGKYAITLSIEADGKARYEELNGFNAYAIEEGIRRIIENMPSWRPAKFKEQGVRAIVMLHLIVESGKR